MKFMARQQGNLARDAVRPGPEKQHGQIGSTGASEGSDEPSLGVSGITAKALRGTLERILPEEGTLLSVADGDLEECVRFITSDIETCTGPGKMGRQV